MNRRFPSGPDTVRLGRDTRCRVGEQRAVKVLPPQIEFEVNVSDDSTDFAFKEIVTFESFRTHIDHQLPFDVTDVTPFGKFVRDGPGAKTIHRGGRLGHVNRC